MTTRPEIDGHEELVMDVMIKFDLFTVDTRHPLQSGCGGGGRESPSWGTSVAQGLELGMADPWVRAAAVEHVAHKTVAAQE